ncbi:MAG: NUDIX hydrolase [Opitutae bacterium]|nr:NUDIX hydrolase [Opitutae bacterium]
MAGNTLAVVELANTGLDKVHGGGLSCRMGKEILYSGKWLAFGEVDAINSQGVPYKWEFATRTGTTNGAVCIIAIKRQPQASIILVKQFRPPIEAEIIELPAGLVEHGQTREEAALKELREETGYVGEIMSVGPHIFNTPGMTDEHVSCVTVEVGEQFEQQTEVDEAIEVIELPIAGLKETLCTLEASGLRIDAKLWCFAAGLELSAVARLGD